MKLYLRSSKTKDRYLQEKWHKKFVIFPVRINPDQIEFCTTILRKMKMGSYSHYDFMGVVTLRNFEYKNIQDAITEKLMNK